MTRKAKKSDIIRDFCTELRLRAIAEHFEELEKTATDYEDFLYQLLSYESEAAEKKLVESRIRCAGFPCRKYLEDLEIEKLPVGIQRALPEISTLRFIEQGQNLIFVGNPGTGKTHTAIGLGIKACQRGYRVLFTTIPLLITELKECRNERRLSAFQKRFSKYDLVIADELGYLTFDREGSELLFTCLSSRSLEKSIIITSNLTFERWSEIFGDAAVTGAMVDRLTYGAKLIDAEGPSYRLLQTLRTNGIDSIDQLHEEDEAAKALVADAEGSVA